jgi:hypothetical protein
MKHGNSLYRNQCLTCLLHLLKEDSFHGRTPRYCNHYFSLSKGLILCFLFNGNRIYINAKLNYDAVSSMCEIASLKCRSRDRMVVGFISTYAISTYHPF